MPIKSFEVISIDAKRFSRLGERIPQLQVDQNTSVTSVTAISDKEVQLEFRFTVNYAKGTVGKIEIDGKIVWDGDARAIATQWSQTRALPPEVFSPVLFAAYTNCTPTAVLTARDLALPPPIPPPPYAQQGQGAKPQKGAGGRDARHSMEVA